MRIKYYQKHKERLRKAAREKHQNLPEEQKQKLLEYMKNYYKKIYKNI